MVETVLTVRMLPTLSSNLGKLDETQRQLVESDHELIRGFTLRRLNKLLNVESLEDTKLSGFANARTILCTPPGGMLAYTADRYGFNNPDHVYNLPVDIALIGDSFVEGFCLPEGKDLTAALRTQSGENAVSLGIRGNGPLIELATLGRFGPELRPNHVIMAFFEGNDWKNLEFELTEPWLREALDEQAEFGSTLPALAMTERRSWKLIQTLTEKPVSNFELMRRTSLPRNFFALHRVGLALGDCLPEGAIGDSGVRKRAQADEVHRRVLGRPIVAPLHPSARPFQWSPADGFRFRSVAYLGEGCGRPRRCRGH